MSTQTDWGGVARIIAAAEAGGMTLGVALRAPDGARFSHCGARRFRAASTVKLAVMIALFRRIEAGEASLAEPCRVAAADMVGGSGVIRHLHDGVGLTLGDLLYLMMSISDNTATNLLIDRVGMAEVNAVMAALGMAASTLGRRMLGVASDAAHENWAAPDDYAGLMLALFDGRAASLASRERMLAVLELQQNDRRIARHLAREDGPRWGSKTGSLAGVCNDVGFVMTPGGPLVLALFAEAVADPLEGERVLGDIAAAALGAIGYS